MFRYSVPAGAASGFGMVSDRFALVVAAGIGMDEALAVWDAASGEDASLEGVLTALSRRGLDRLPDFAVVELRDSSRRTVSVALRGAGVVHLLGDESRRLAGDGAGTWIESSADAVTRMSVGLHSAAPGAHTLPLVRGVALTDRLHLGLAPRTADDASIPDGTLRAPATGGPGDTAAIPDWALDALAADAFEAEPSVFASGGAEKTVLPESDPAPEDHTLLSSRVAARASGPDDAPPSGGAPTPPLGLVFADGRTMPLDRPVVVGRAPVVPDDAVAGTLPSPRKEVSSTHARLEAIEGERLRIGDLGSTNGTLLVPAEGPARILRGGEPLEVGLGTSIDFGDGNRAVFTRLA